MEAQTLGLYCDQLDDFRAKLDETIRGLMLNLTERDLEDGTVTAKIKVVRRIVVDEANVARTMIRMEPTVGFKIVASGQAKCDTANGLLLAYGENGEPVIGENQITIEEYMRSQEDRTA